MGTAQGAGLDCRCPRSRALGLRGLGLLGPRAGVRSASAPQLWLWGPRALEVPAETGCQLGHSTPHRPGAYAAKEWTSIVGFLLWEFVFLGKHTLTD